jgi:serine/threonine-protein kinase
VSTLAARAEALGAEGRLAEAAALWAEAGEHARAARLLEQACEYAAAAEQALAAQQYGRAVAAAVLAGDPAGCAAVIAAVVTRAEPTEVRRIAADLEARGRARHAGDLLAALGDLREAAASFERAGASLEAARCHDQAGKPAQAARVLESALRADGSSADPDGLRLALGRLYARHGKHQAAVRVLQQIGDGSGCRREALTILTRALAELGLEHAQVDLVAELGRLGPAEGADVVRSDQPVQAAEAAPTDRGRQLETAPAGSTDAKLYGRYRVRRVLATTVHARVIEALDDLTGELVVVKLFAARMHGVGRDALQRFAREAEALSRLRHPNVLPLREFLPDGPAMVLEHMAGGSLADLLARETLSPARAAEIAGAVLAALGEAHRLGILHRDVKPSNVLFDGAGTARLGDFGAAHLGSSQATMTVGEIGTLGYMAPEQRLGAPACVGSDIYSAGALLYQMLTGTLAPTGADSVTVGWAHPDLERSHDALLARLLAVEPAARFESAGQARAALAALPWSSRVLPRPAPRPACSAEARPAAERGEHERLRPIAADGRTPAGCERAEDCWLGREVLLLACDDATRARAGAFARADQPLFATVLKLDEEAGKVWIEALGGEVALPLTEAERHALRAALEALHRAGAVHGRVDGRHLLRDAGGVRLAYAPEPPAGATAADDLAALAAL